jgi:hypothetical protein
MSISRTKALAFGLLAMVLVGASFAASASAEAGPFWHHRAIGGKGEGEKLAAGVAESFKGTGGEQILLGNIASTEVEISSSSLQVKGAITNGAHQGQAKFELIYNQPVLRKPALSCGVVVGEKNIAQVKAHLAWKWNGTSAQLALLPQITEQTPDLIFTNVEPQEQKPSGVSDYRKVGVFTTITLKGSGCGVIAGTFNVEGSEVGIPNRKIEEFATKLAVRTVPSQTSINKEAGEGAGFLQHVWEGSAYQGLIIGLVFGKNPASLIGQSEVEPAQQEIAVFEK